MQALPGLVTFALVCATAGCSGPDAAPPGADAQFPAQALQLVTGDSKLVDVEVRTAPDQPPQRGTIAVEYRVTDAADGSPVDDLAISVVPWMPAMGHGTSIVPEVHAKGDGRYVLVNVNLFMPGRWELKSQISGPLVDRVAPAFQIP